MLRLVRVPRLASLYHNGAVRGPLYNQTCRQLSGAAQSVIEVASDQDFDSEVKAAHDAGQLAVVDFTAKWCGPCKVMAPVYTQLASLYPTVRFLKADIDTPALEKTVMDNGIASVPTFVFIKDGQKSKFSGADPQQLVKVLDELK